MYPLETRELAVEAVAAGFSLTEAAELAGCSRTAVVNWAKAAGVAPPPRKKAVYLPFDRKMELVARLEAGERAADLAAEAGVTAAAVSGWRRRLREEGALSLMTDSDIAARAPEPREAPSELEELRARCEELELRNAVLEGTIDILKKDPGADLSALTAAERAALADRLRGRFGLRAALAALSLPRSTFYDRLAAASAPDPYAALRPLVRAAFEASGGAYGYRRVRAELGLATLGWTVSRGPTEGGSDGRSKAPEAFHRRVQEADCVALQRREAAKRDHARVRSREHDAAKVDQLHQRHRLAARRRQQDARAEQDHRVGAREQEAPHGGRRPKTSGADIRTKVTVIAANADRYPVSAQCEILGVPRSTYYYLRSRPEPPPAPDPVEPDVLAVHAESKGRYGARKVKASLERRGVVASRRRISCIMRENGLSSAYGRKRFKAHPGKPNEAELPNVLDRSFDGYAPRTHVCSDLTYVRAGGSWCYVCLLVDLYNREIVGCSAGSSKGAKLVKAAFATLEFPISDIEVFHTDRGSEFDNAEIDLMLETFGIERSLSAKGCPYDNAVDESTNKILKAELVYRDSFSGLRDLQAKLSDYVHWYNNFRIHSTLGYMSPVEFRKAGLILSKPSK